MKTRHTPLLIFACLITLNAFAQTNYSDDPLDAQFVTTDVDRFWAAYDQLDDSDANPFEAYLEEGSPGLKGFIQYRIESAEALLQMVNSRRADYEKSRNVLDTLDTQVKRIRAIYSAMKYWYPDATFPPVYFVVGRFNSGGTVSEKGILLGTEMLDGLSGLPGLVAHELIHFQQTFVEEDNTLLRQSLVEGGADFIGELISGTHINETAFTYGEAHEEQLGLEFALKMGETSYEDWMYGTSGKDDRPNDLGYWMGYKIAAAYFENTSDKHQAIRDLLAMEDPQAILKKSGYLDSAIAAVAEMSDEEKLKFTQKYSPETYPITIRVEVPNEEDVVYITGNQPSLGEWNPAGVEMKKISPNAREIQLELHLPASFKFTRGEWTKEALMEGVSGLPNLRLEAVPEGVASYRIEKWKDQATGQ